jgi:hypothetical protein
MADDHLCQRTKKRAITNNLTIAAAAKGSQYGYSDGGFDVLCPPDKNTAAEG